MTVSAIGNPVRVAGPRMRLRLEHFVMGGAILCLIVLVVLPLLSLLLGSVRGEQGMSLDNFAEVVDRWMGKSSQAQLADLTAHLGAERAREFDELTTAELHEAFDRELTAVAGVEPRYMGIGPAPAARKALAKAGMTLAQMDLVEVNEAFSAQYVAVERELGLDRERTNVDGGAIAIGHPLAASGTRITLHLLMALRRRGKRFGLGSACIGGGQGAAVIVEAF